MRTGIDLAYANQLVQILDLSCRGTHALLSAARQDDSKWDALKAKATEVIVHSENGESALERSIRDLGIGCKWVGRIGMPSKLG